MHAFPRFLLLALVLTGWAAADLPRKMPLNSYSRLWKDSPFTAKPPPPDAGPVVNPLENYALVGVSPIVEGYCVTLIDKKSPDIRVTVESGSTKNDFKILSVTRKPGDPLGTIVRMQSGASTGTVSFDEKLLVLAKPAPVKKTAKRPPGVKPKKAGRTPTRQPRPRVVPPPTNKAPNKPGQRPNRRGR